MGIRAYYDATLDLREAMSLRKPLADWLPSTTDAVRRVRNYVPHDYDLHTAYARATLTHISAHFLQHVATLAHMRKAFFARETPLWHSMAVVIEWTEQEIMRLCGTNITCVFKKHQQWQRNAARRRRERERARKQRCADARAIQKRRRAMTTARLHYARQIARKRKRDTTQLDREAAVYAKWVRRNEWTIINRSQLFEALKNARQHEFKHALTIVEHYIPGMTNTGKIDVMQWTNATCAHVYYEAFHVPRA